MLSGFNCTIFAYGQTGTGKTYTMSGDISDVLPLPDAAGIIPRVLHSLFEKLGDEESENSVKCSFIELYNEELRDLLSHDDNVKLKIYDDSSKKGSSSTLVQGMEESHIKSASNGIRLLREGSHKRQVAATKCNDLSSRSHTVFTITVYLKRTSDTGEDFVSAGKLNLVDLAGSENIQRSGAENKRAAEAGLINKSLLTLGRVINALVDKSSHIPYRESKLTRLLQDSLGGRTKTCIIATLSPAKSNLEETISTLDYAFRAKNIRNKPQVNQMVSKKTLLKEFTAEIEKLKSELIATRQRNGVYLTAESYEEITTESESRRILSEEQRDKLETMESNLRNKVQELFSLTSNFHSLKKDNEATRMVLDGTKSLLEKTEVVLTHTRQSLAEETVLRKAHEQTEDKLASIGQDLISSLGRTTTDIDGLHSKIRRKSDMQSVNRGRWSSSQAQVTDTTLLVETRIQMLQSQQEQLMTGLASRMQSFIQDELQKLETSQSFLQERVQAYQKSETEVNEQTAKARDDMNEVLEEIKTLRQDVKEKVGAGLNDLSAAAQRISASIVTELDAFQTQVCTYANLQIVQPLLTSAQIHSSYASLGRDFKSTFDDLVKRLNQQQEEANALRQQILTANQELVASNQRTQNHLVEFTANERERAAKERQALLAQITTLIQSAADSQEARIDGQLRALGGDISSAYADHKNAQDNYSQGMDIWSTNSASIVSSILSSRDAVKTKIKSDFASANTHTTSLRQTTTSVHDTTVRIVADQMSHMDTQLQSLDHIVARVRAQNSAHHTAHVSSLSDLSSAVQTSYDSVGDAFATSFQRVQGLGADMDDRIGGLNATLPALDAEAEIRQPLRELRETLNESALLEYQATGETPQRTSYAFPLSLPRTDAHAALSGLRRRANSANAQMSPSKGRFAADGAYGAVTNADDEQDAVSLLPTPELPLQPQAQTQMRPPSSSASSTHGHGLRELDINTLPAATMQSSPSRPSTSTSTASAPKTPVAPALRRGNTLPVPAAGGEKEKEGRLPTKKAGRMTVAGIGGADRENLPVGGTAGRRLRSQGGT